MGDKLLGSIVPHSFGIARFLINPKSTSQQLKKRKNNLRAGQYFKYIFLEEEDVPDQILKNGQADKLVYSGPNTDGGTHKL